MTLKNYSQAIRRVSTANVASLLGIMTVTSLVFLNCEWPEVPIKGEVEFKKDSFGPRAFDKYCKELTSYDKQRLYQKMTKQIEAGQFLVSDAKARKLKIITSQNNRYYVKGFENDSF